MIRTLVIPNITWGGRGKDLTQDSYVDFLYRFILAMKYKRQDIYWYVLIPDYDDEKEFGKKSKEQTKLVMKKLRFPNLKIIKIKIPRMPFNRIHFDFFELKQKINWKEEPIDLIFCNQPELMKQYRVFFSSLTNLVPPVIGYSHFFEFSSLNWEGVFDLGISGILVMDKCFLNTQAQKEEVIKEASKTFNQTALNKLQRILKPFPPIVMDTQVRTGNKTPKKRIVWNHRLGDEKGYKFFENTIKELRKQRQDFELWCPLMKPKQKLSKENWVLIGNNIPKKKYYEELRDCWVGVSGKQRYKGWSIATTDGLMNGVPYLMYDDDYYKELNEGGDFYKNKKELLKLLNLYLDNKKHRNKMSIQAHENILHNQNYKKRINEVSKLIDKIVLSGKSMDTTISGISVVKLIKKMKRISHKKMLKEMNWGLSIKVLPYRRTILNTKGIKEEPDNPKSIYTYKKQ